MAKVIKPALPYHFFASTHYGWGTGDTEEEAIKRASVGLQPATVKNSVAEHNGIICWSVKVELPRTEHYNIAGFMPVKVPMCDEKEHRIVGPKGEYITTKVEPQT